MLQFMQSDGKQNICMQKVINRMRNVLKLFPKISFTYSNFSDLF